MKVKDLIEELKKYDLELEVMGAYEGILTHPSEAYIGGEYTSNHKVERFVILDTFNDD